MPFDDAFEHHMQHLDASFQHKLEKKEMKALERLMVGAANTKEIVTKVGELRDLPNTLKTEMHDRRRETSARCCTRSPTRRSLKMNTGTSTR